MARCTLFITSCRQKRKQTDRGMYLYCLYLNQVQQKTVHVWTFFIQLTRPGIQHGNKTDLQDPRGREPPSHSYLNPHLAAHSRSILSFALPSLPAARRHRLDTHRRGNQGIQLCQSAHVTLCDGHTLCVQGKNIALHKELQPFGLRRMDAGNGGQSSVNGSATAF